MQLSYVEITRIKAIANHFKIADGEITHIIKVDTGRINSTYKVTVTCESDTVSYMLQRINVYVFSNVSNVMENAIKVTTHLRNKGIETLEFVQTKEGEYLYFENDEVFRMTKFIHAEVFQNVTRPKDMYNLGYAVGKFSVGLSDFDTTSLHDTIPNFHNTRIRYENLLVSAVNNVIKIKDGRVSTASTEIEFANDNREQFGIIVDSITRGEIPIRVTHNDTKLNNVLFDRKTNVPRCLIDLDTVMNGSILYDIADAIRSGANVSSEDERNKGIVRIDLELVKEFLKGFKEASGDLLTPKEISLIPIAIKIIPFELGMRFLTDYFDGDKYFGIVNSDDNLNRAKVQFALVRSIEVKMTEIERIVKEVFN